jgi:hypothetical protein
MTAIEVDFEVFKALTARRATEAVTYNEVIRGLLGLGAGSRSQLDQDLPGATFKGVLFPEGTQFRATYKGRTYTAEIRGGVWRDSDGSAQNSPSAAAVRITEKPWNGWRFWHCKRPGETSWTLIEAFRSRVQARVEEL